jgi:hypothetical protein
VLLSAADDATVRGPVLLAWQNIAEKRVAGTLQSLPLAGRGSRKSRT